MKKTLLCLAGLVLAGAKLYAQESENLIEPSETIDKTQKLEHHVGVQINQLIRQVFNFNNSTASDNPNPFLAIYSVNLKNSGWGLRTGGGYNYQKFTDNDGITQTETERNLYNARFGIEKAFQLSDKWTAGAGIDGVMSYEKNNTKTTLQSSDTIITTTISKEKSFGGGGMAWLRYNITPRLQIGTEASFYYLSGKNDQEVTITRKPFSPSNNITTIVTPVNSKTASGTLSLPVAFYLLVKF